ncbi:hypothetical protein [Sporisorium scitamineum]|nr:hypothetical protein [Sporisorium scitamineum]
MTTKQVKARLETTYDAMFAPNVVDALTEAGESGSAIDEKKDSGAGKSSLKKRDFDHALFKRAMSDLDFVSSVKSKRHETASDEDGSNSVLFNGVEMTQRQVADEAVRIAKQATAYSTQDSGFCPERSSTCREKFCQMTTPDCIGYTDEEKHQLQQGLCIVLNEVFSSGSCDASAAASTGDDGKSNNCDESGECQLWLKNGQRDRNCKPLKQEELKSRLEDALNSLYASGAVDGGDHAAAGDATSGKKKLEGSDATNSDKKDAGADKVTLQKRNVDRSLIKRELIDGPVRQDLLKRIVSMDEPDIHGADKPVPGSDPAFVTIDKSALLSPDKLYQPTDQEVYQFMSVCAELSQNHDALEQVANAAGVYNQDDVDRLGEHFAELSQDKEEAKKVMQQAKMAQMVRESKSGVGAIPVDDLRDHRKPTMAEQLRKYSEMDVEPGTKFIQGDGGSAK